VSIEPVTSWIAARRRGGHELRRHGLVAAADQHDGIHRRARISSSVSIAIRLRRYMLVGAAKLAWIDIVGNVIGNPPASITPRSTAAISCGALPWQGF
jgi:hypothetical protein